MADDDLPDRMRVLERDQQSLLQSHTSLHTDYYEFKAATQRNLDRLEALLNGVSGEVKSLSAELKGGLEKVNASLNNVTTSALQSAPPWVLQAMQRNGVIVQILTAVSTGLAAALITVLLNH
jgi:hypothetical protein